MALRLTSAENYASDIVHPYTAVIYQTLKSVFPVVAVSPGPTNFFFGFAAIRPASAADPGVLAGRYRAPGPAAGRPGPDFLFIIPGRKNRASSRPPCRNTRSGPEPRPAAHRLFSGRPLAGLEQRQPPVRPVRFFRENEIHRPAHFHAAAAAAGLPVDFIQAPQRVPGNFSVLLAAASGGFAGLSFEITDHFHLPEHLGFCLPGRGPADRPVHAGAWRRRRLDRPLDRKKRPPSEAAGNRWPAVQIAYRRSARPACRCCKPFANWAGRRGAALFVWLGGMGLLVGAILPLGMRVLRHLPAGLSAGLLNAGDYLGGAIGSLLMAAFFLPLLGTAKQPGADLPAGRWFRLPCCCWPARGRPRRTGEQPKGGIGPVFKNRKRR